MPEGPGSSPYVTAVGGTTPARGFPSPGSEEVCAYLPAYSTAIGTGYGYSRTCTSCHTGGRAVFGRLLGLLADAELAGGGGVCVPFLR